MISRTLSILNSGTTRPRCGNSLKVCAFSIMAKPNCWAAVGLSWRINSTKPRKSAMAGFAKTILKPIGKPFSSLHPVRSFHHGQPLPSPHALLLETPAHAKGNQQKHFVLRLEVWKLPEKLFPVPASCSKFNSKTKNYNFLNPCPIPCLCPWGAGVSPANFPLPTHAVARFSSSTWEWAAFSAVAPPAAAFSGSTLIGS